MAADIDLGPAAEAFREEVREWLGKNRLGGLEHVDARYLARAVADPALDEWTRRLSEGGYMCVGWPKEYGGRGLGAIEVAVMNEEFAGAGVPRVTRGMGEWLVGPSIIVHGTEEQKARFLPRIISGEDRYCQGFSEPDAGSDLAGLKTRGVVDGDEIVISGQKVWTSGAQVANMMFVLCRTDPEAPKHRGISYVLLPMYRDDGSSNGIELRPIRQITGSAHFTESFLTDARAPAANVIGGLNQGWKVTMTTLGNERGGHTTTQHVEYRKQWDEALELVRSLGRSGDPHVRQLMAWAYSNVEIMRFAGLRLLAEMASHKEPGPAASINKMFWSEYVRDFTERLINVLGPHAMIRPDSGNGSDYALGGWQSSFLETRSGTIWGGTAQIQRNIVGERVLGLPKEPKPESRK
ncbi:MAG: acyl-CoA dehydrogenase family protein [Acidimicrobiia bacterium]|nr:acyl-CoA dehydrogenase family protein [Acidimicrobiia bacterium]